MAKTTAIQIRVSKQEKAEIERLAKAAGEKVGGKVGISEFLRNRAFGKTFEPPQGRPKKAPSPEEVEALAVKIHNTEGLPMARSRAIALTRMAMDR